MTRIYKYSVEKTVFSFHEKTPLKVETGPKTTWTLRTKLQFG